MKKAGAYDIQNAAIHQARRQLADEGILNPWASLEQVREMAAEINNGVLSISKLSIEQRWELIDQLIKKGARVRNPTFYETDLRRDVNRVGKPRKVLNLFGAVAEERLRLVDSVARQIRWPAPNSYENLCFKLFESARPRNNTEVRRLFAVLTNILKKDGEKNAARSNG